MQGNQQGRTAQGRSTAQFYGRLSRESQVMEGVVKSYSVVLTSTLAMLGFSEVENKQFEIREIREVRDRVLIKIALMKRTIERQLTTIIEMVESIGQIRIQMQQLADLQTENERSSSTLESLRAQLNQKQLQITKCNRLIAVGRQQKQQQEWKRNHYVNIHPIKFNELVGTDYLSVLKGVEHKLKLQINYEQQERILLNYKVSSKLSDFKTSLIHSWGKLGYCDRQYNDLVKNAGAKSQSEESLDISYTFKASEQQKKFVDQDRLMNDLDISKAQTICNKLNLDEDSPVSSQQRLTYSQSGQARASTNAVIHYELIE